jgi:hypothetical protein
MFKSANSDARSSVKKGQKMESFDDRSRKQKMKPVKKDKYRPGSRGQEEEDEE